MKRGSFMVSRWYVVQAKPKHELTAIQNLENQHFTCYLPQFIVTRKARGATIQLVEPLFPSYLFVKFDIDIDRWRAISGTRGVIKILSSSEDAASALPDGFVEDMISQADSRGYLTIMKVEKAIRKFIPGDLLRINEGVFEGFTGTCERIQKDYAVLLLALLSGKVEVKLPLNSVEFA